MLRNISNRIGFVCSLLAALFTFFAFRLVNLQVGGHEKFLKLAVEKHGFKKPIFAQRGAIYDRHGEALAVNVPVRTVTADGTHIKDPAAVAHIAASFLNMKESDLVAKLSTKRPYVVIQNASETAIGQRGIGASVGSETLIQVTFIFLVKNTNFYTKY